MVILVKGANMFISESSLKDEVTRVVSNTTMGYPTAKADVKNSKGIIGVYHNGCILVGAISMREPRLD
jgi:hypothetical protein